MRLPLAVRVFPKRGAAKLAIGFDRAAEGGECFTGRQARAHARYDETPLAPLVGRDAGKRPTEKQFISPQLQELYPVEHQRSETQHDHELLA